MKPYTYLIRHRPTNRVYYGVRSANKVEPEQDLWYHYFTSSPKVQQLIEETGRDSFDVEVRRVFETREQAIAWETRVLRRCRVLEDDRWINQNVAGYIIPTEESRRKIREFHKDKPKSEEHKKNLSRSQKGKPKVNSKNQTPEYRALMSTLKSGSNNPMYGKTHSKETKKKIGEKNRIHMQGDNNPMKKVVWTEERREHMRQIRAKRQPWTEDQKKAVAEKLRGRKREKIHCPHCDRDIAQGWYDRHGDRCRKRTS
jgi:hypothetical protein|nr:hypothetical protein [Oxalobacteraceae bacterium]